MSGEKTQPNNVAELAREIYIRTVTAGSCGDLNYRDAARKAVMAADEFYAEVASGDSRRADAGGAGESSPAPKATMPRPAWASVMPSNTRASAIDDADVHVVWVLRNYKNSGADVFGRDLADGTRQVLTILGGRWNTYPRSDIPDGEILWRKSPWAAKLPAECDDGAEGVTKVWDRCKPNKSELFKDAYRRQLENGVKEFFDDGKWMVSPVFTDELAAKIPVLYDADAQTDPADEPLAPDGKPWPADVVQLGRDMRDGAFWVHRSDGSCYWWFLNGTAESSGHRSADEVAREVPTFYIIFDRTKKAAPETPPQEPAPAKPHGRREVAKWVCQGKYTDTLVELDDGSILMDRGTDHDPSEAGFVRVPVGEAIPAVPSQPTPVKPRPAWAEGLPDACVDDAEVVAVWTLPGCTYRIRKGGEEIQLFEDGRWQNIPHNFELKILYPKPTPASATNPA